MSHAENNSRSTALWVTGTDLAKYPTPEEVCAIALAIKANFSQQISEPTAQATILLRESPQYDSPRTETKEEIR